MVGPRKDEECQKSPFRKGGKINDLPALPLNLSIFRDGLDASGKNIYFSHVESKAQGHL
jgi:hypothetical protein